MFLTEAANRGSISTGYDIDHSYKNENDNTERMYRAWGGITANTRTWTTSLWIKRTELGACYIWGAGVSGNDVVVVDFDSSDRLGFRSTKDAANDCVYRTNRTFRDIAAWYHLVFAVDTTSGTAGNRLRIYVNGVEETSFATETNFDQNDLTLQNANGSYMEVGSVIGESPRFNGYIAEVNHITGTQYAPTAFGEFDEDSGIWIPIKFTGSYAENSVFLEFKDSSSLGTDTSGNDQPFTLQNLSAADQATDTPTNNFCTWSPLWAESRANGTITEGATQVAWGGSAWKIARSSMAVSKGRWYWEIKGANVTGDTWNNNLFGFASVEGDNGQYGPTVMLGYSTGNYYYRIANSQTGSDDWGNAGGAWSSSDTFGFALDLESATKKFILYRNGSAVNGSGTDLPSAFQTEQFFTPYATAYNGDTQFLNWGGYTVNTISSAASDANGYGTFEYAPPSGYYALCSKNLAEYG
jgi:hypothetical protein